MADAGGGWEEGGGVGGTATAAARPFARPPPTVPRRGGLAQQRSNARWCSGRPPPPSPDGSRVGKRAAAGRQGGEGGRGGRLQPAGIPREGRGGCCGLVCTWQGGASSSRIYHPSPTRSRPQGTRAQRGLMARQTAWGRASKLGTRSSSPSLPQPPLRAIRPPSPPKKGNVPPPFPNGRLPHPPYPPLAPPAATVGTLRPIPTARWCCSVMIA